ncbi:MAG: flavin reductase family protein [Thermoleophilia bacterium]
MDAPSVSSQQFRDTLSLWPSGVTVVTAQGPHGPTGMTASSFSSLSLDPPLVLICVARHAKSHDALCGAPGFAVHVLDRTQSELSTRFAKPGYEKFTPQDWEPGPFDAPILPMGVARMVCEHHSATQTGDHTILVGRVISSEITEAEPLLFWNRQYRTVGDR